MTRFRIAVALALLGVILAGVAFYNRQPVVALALLLAGIYVALGVILGISDSLENPMFKAAAAVIGILGIAGVFLYNRAFDVNLQQAYPEAAYALATMQMQCPAMSPALRNIQEFGIKACALQGNGDQMRALIELQKGVNFGPTLTLADSAIALQSGTPANYCAKAASAAAALCPAAFDTMSGPVRHALLKAAE